MDEYHVAGCMSGTSLDGLDIAFCRFIFNNNTWNFEILFSQTISYPQDLKLKLATIHEAKAFDFWKLHVDYGHWIGSKVKELSEFNNLKYDWISSHGHTIFHDPTSARITCQIGEGNAIAGSSGKPVIFDFRQLDVALGGNGAPLVPVGEKYLFPQYQSFINLGGIANISIHKHNETIGFDIVPCNLVLNHLANLLGLEYDNAGEIASKGSLQSTLLEKLNALDFYNQPPPKSLGREWLDSNIFPILGLDLYEVKDILYTFCHHIAQQISFYVPNNIQNVLITGGGAYNTFLIKLIKHYAPNTEFVIPSKHIIEYKEALIFAFLGVLRWLHQDNCFNSVTGSSKNNSGGVIAGSGLSPSQ